MGTVSSIRYDAYDIVCHQIFYFDEPAHSILFAGSTRRSTRLCSYKAPSVRSRRVWIIMAGAPVFAPVETSPHKQQRGVLVILFLRILFLAVFQRSLAPGRSVNAGNVSTASSMRLQYGRSTRTMTHHPRRVPHGARAPVGTRLAQAAARHASACAKGLFLVKTKLRGWPL